jgi:hypothetical protein
VYIIAKPVLLLLVQIGINSFAADLPESSMQEEVLAVVQSWTA